MKKRTIKLVKALSLNLETIAKLDDEQLGAIEGGKQAQTTGQSSCPAFSCNPANCRGVPTTE